MLLHPLARMSTSDLPLSPPPGARAQKTKEVKRKVFGDCQETVATQFWSKLNSD